jgi:hypothetical protein
MNKIIFWLLLTSSLFASFDSLADELNFFDEKETNQENDVLTEQNDDLSGKQPSIQLDAESRRLESLVNDNIILNDPVSTYTKSTSVVQAKVFGLNPYVGLQPKKLKFDQVSVIPTLNVEMGYNDNLGLKNSNKTGSIGIILSPKIIASVDKGANKYSLAYSGSFYDYRSSSIDNRQNNEISISANNGFTRKSNLNWNISYLDGAEERGFRDDSLVSNANTPNEFRRFSGNVKYVYGSKNAIGNIELSSGFTDLAYTNNRNVTTNGDYETFNYGINFVYRLTPKTFVSIGVIQAKTDFIASTSNQDNIDTRQTLAVRWNADTKSQLYFKGGRQSRNFESSQVDDLSTNFYQVGAFWSPLTYSTLEFYSGRGVIDGTISSIINGISQSYGLNWRHVWTQSFTSSFNINRTKTDFDGFSNSSNRTDKVNGFGINSNYKLKKNMDLTLNYTYLERNSSEELFTYNINVLMFGMNLSL